MLAPLNGCGQKNQDPTPTTGVAGTVTVIDQNRKTQLRGGVTVTKLNTNLLLTATTNDAGEFIIGAAPTGTYSLVFTKPGLSTFLFRSVAHPQVEVITRLPETYSLVQEPTIWATGLQATSITAGMGGGAVPVVDFRTTLTTL